MLKVTNLLSKNLKPIGVNSRLFTTNSNTPNNKSEDYKKGFDDGLSRGSVQTAFFIVFGVILSFSFNRYLEKR